MLKSSLKRYFALMLALVMVLSMVPVQAFAEETVDYDDEIVEEPWEDPARIPAEELPVEETPEEPELPPEEVPAEEGAPSEQLPAEEEPSEDEALPEEDEDLPEEDEDLPEEDEELTEEDEDVLFDEEMYAVGEGSFLVGDWLYTDLQDAVDAAAAMEDGGTVVLVEDATLEAGEYTIPANVKLLIPFDKDNIASFTDLTVRRPAQTPEVYRTLTMASGAVIRCYGQINVNAAQNKGGGSNETSTVSGPYGAIDMEQDSVIELIGKDAKLYCYGYIGGDGLVDAQSGSEVYQLFQLMDWRGGSAILLLKDLILEKVRAGEDMAFFISQYFIQNVEASLKINYGSSLKAVLTITADGYGTPELPAIEVMGTSGMFKVGPGGSATLTYEPESDRVRLDLDGSMEASSIIVSMAGYTVDSAMLVLGLPMNYTVNVRSGELTFSQRFSLLPGTQLNVGPGASATVNKSGKIFLYDQEDWNAHSFVHGHTGKDTIEQLPYVHAQLGRPVTRTSTQNAVLRVDGTLTANGPVCSTGAAGITGTGKFVNNASGKAETLYEIVQNGTAVAAEPVACTPVVGSLAGHEGKQSFNAGTYASNGSVWYERKILCPGFQVVSGATAGEPGVAYAATAQGEKIVDLKVVLEPSGSATEGMCPKNATVTGATGTMVDGQLHISSMRDAEVQVQAGGHVGSAWNKVAGEDRHSSTCQMCGETVYEDCRGGTATCKQQATCDVCREKYGARAAHDQLHEVAAVAATCQQEGVKHHWHCDTCGNNYADKEAITRLPSIVEDIAQHVDEDGDWKCDNCGTIICGDQHVPEVIRKIEPTCQEAGQTGFTWCSRCHTILEGERKTIDPLPHDFENSKEYVVSPGVHQKKCAICHEELGPQENHSGGKPTCEQDGVCQVCGAVYMDRLGHDWNEGVVTVEPTCTEAGEKTYTCWNDSTHTRTETLEALGHDLEQKEGRLPTYQSSGWDAYDVCKRECGYSTFQSIEPLTAKADNFNDFVRQLAQLETMAEDYITVKPGADPLALMIKYIRTGVDRYNSGSWGIMAGYEDAEFAQYVREQEEAYNLKAASTDEMISPTGVKSLEEFALPNGNWVDFGHMFGMMDITYHNKFSQNHEDVSGWGGDLVDLLDMTSRHGVTGSIEAMAEDIRKNYLGKNNGESDIFSQTDIYGDMDGFYLIRTLRDMEYEPGALTDLIESYFTPSLSDEARAEYLLRGRLGGTNTRANTREAVYDAYTGNKMIATLEGTRDIAASNVDQLRIACCYAFADYLCELAGDYVDVTGNPYFEEFFSETSTLAPGVTQQIKRATTVDGKQMAYFLATADVTRDDVHVFANYNENDPTYWKMSRVLDQLNAAQAKYGDPDSAQYIPNYSAVAAINADGYNMSTGEPGGLLVMNGKEYHPCGGNGFFGILKDGRAVIGTAEEYNTIYRGQVQEAVGNFGPNLIKDGKVLVTAGEGGAYLSQRVTRTAVGITRTGKVVFMVLDGRQEPYSCGGSMVEIAQIMLEAGCVDAINLDGGGSTTFVAKQEGADAASVVNSPSDGYARSVSDTLMIVSTAPSSTAFDHAVVDADKSYLTVDSSVQLSAVGVSATGNSAAIPEGAVWAVSNSGIGSVSADGVFTAAKNGDVTVSLMLGSQTLGSKDLHVVVPDAVYFTRSSIPAVYGERVLMPVAARFKGKPVAINERDVALELERKTVEVNGIKEEVVVEAGSFDGFYFIGDESKGIRYTKLTARSTADPSVFGTIAVTLYKQGEGSFDFDQATGGDRQLSWDRKVSNATTDDQMVYVVQKEGEPMTTSYVFAIDMTQIPVPSRLADLTYMLPGADAEDSSAWNFLLQLAERISVLTVVKPVLKFDPEMDVDYSEVKMSNEYFDLEEAVLDPETNELTLTMRWKNQTQPIDASMANPLCIITGIKLTPKSGAAWDRKDRLNVENSGTIGYKIYMRAHALYTFSEKPENQQIYGLYPFVNPDVIVAGEPEMGGYFEDVYHEFSDSYTLVNSRKNGWVGEDGGYAYYVDGLPLTGYQEVDGLYFYFDANGINKGKLPYTGMFEKDGAAYYAKAGVLQTGWIAIEGEDYCFDANGRGYDGSVKVDEVDMVFEKGKLVDGHTGFVTKSDGKRYYYDHGKKVYGWKQVGDQWYHLNVETGVVTTGTKVRPDQETASKGTWYDFADDGRLLRGYFNGFGYYYWAGLPAIDMWVHAGNDPDHEAWYRTNGNGHFVVDPSGQHTFEYEQDGKKYTAVRILFDGVLYTFDNSNGKLLRGQIVRKNGELYYFWAGQPKDDGWFELDGEKYYALSDGRLARGLHKIDGQEYLFDNDGRLSKQTYAVLVEMSQYYQQMKIRVVDTTRKLSSAYVAVWATERGQAETLRWLEVKKDAEGELTLTIPMCSFNMNTADIFAVHAYDSARKEVLAATNIDVPVAVTHDYDNDQDTTCDRCGYVRELSGTIEVVPMYRLFNPNSHEHFYTGSTVERDDLVKLGWQLEGIAWNAPVKIGQPMHRLFNPNTGDHHYTASEVEIDTLMAAGWQYENVAWNSASEEHVPQFRLYNPNEKQAGIHHYTSSKQEMDHLVSLGWKYEGIGWYGVK